MRSGLSRLQIAPLSRPPNLPAPHQKNGWPTDQPHPGVLFWLSTMMPASGVTSAPCAANCLAKSHGKNISNVEDLRNTILDVLEHRYTHEKGPFGLGQDKLFNSCPLLRLAFSRRRCQNRMHYGIDSILQQQRQFVPGHARKLER